MKPFKMKDTTIGFLNKYSLIFQGITAVLLVFVIEWMSRHSLVSALQFVIETPLVYLYNVLLVFASFLAAYILRRRTLVRLVLIVFWLLLGIINGALLANRVTPFNFTDLKLVGDLLAMKNSKYFTASEEVMVIILLIALAAFLVFLGIKGPKYEGRMHRVRYAVAIAVFLVGIPILTKGAIRSDILEGYFGNLAQGYKDNGFVYSFTASVVDTGMSKPSGYDEWSVKNTLRSVKTQPTELEAEELPNIIFVQLETFIDPYELNFLTCSEDPIPTFHKLMEENTSGYLTVPVVGAGTSNTEFEVLTGMGISYFGLGEYPYKTVLKETACESAASDLKQIGYSTHALHNNGGNFYSRAHVFSQMGFDTFTSKELMNITEFNEIDTWPKDDILVEETRKALDASENQADFIYTITVQSHGSYPEYKVFEHPDIEVTGGETPEINYQWEYYINELHQVDQFIGDLIQELNSRDEHTLLVLYGDHLPTMGLEDEDMRNGDIYKTTYTSWNNFGLEKQDRDVTSYQLMAYMTNLLGIHEGTIFTLHQQELFAPHFMDYDKKREMLQYDLLYGERYAYGGEDRYPASDLVMGIDDVTLESVGLNEEQSALEIRGQNFTPWSKVYVDGEKMDTEYDSEHLLRISIEDLEAQIQVQVNQVGSSSTIFRSSNEMTYSFPTGFFEQEHEEEEIENTMQNGI